MKITPLDIQQKQFTRSSWKGFSPQEVQTYLDAVSSELEAQIRENGMLKEQLKKAEATLDDYREREKSLKDTLVMAQRMMEDIKAGAMKEAEVVIGEARMQGEQIIASAHARLTQLVDEIQDLKAQRIQMVAALRGTIETHNKLLEITEKQLEKRDALEDRLPALRGPRPVADGARSR